MFYLRAFVGLLHTIDLKYIFFILHNHLFDINVEKTIFLFYAGLLISKPFLN